MIDELDDKWAELRDATERVRPTEGFIDTVLERIASARMTSAWSVTSAHIQGRSLLIASLSMTAGVVLTVLNVRGMYSLTDLAMRALFEASL